MSRGRRFDIPPHAMKKIGHFHAVIVEIVAGIVYADAANIGEGETRFSDQFDIDLGRMAHFKPYQLKPGSYFEIVVWKGRGRMNGCVELRPVEIPPFTEEQIRKINMDVSELHRNLQRIKDLDTRAERSSRKSAR